MSSGVVKMLAKINLGVNIIGCFIATKISSEISSEILNEFTVFFVALISALFVFIILMAIGQILENTEQLLYLEKTRPSSAPPHIDGASNSKMKLSSLSSISSGDTWRCPECETSNPKNSRTCKGCGYQK